MGTMPERMSEAEEQQALSELYEIKGWHRLCKKHEEYTSDCYPCFLDMKTEIEEWRMKNGH